MKRVTELTKIEEMEIEGVYLVKGEDTESNAPTHLYYLKPKQNRSVETSNDEESSLSTDNVSGNDWVAYTLNIHTGIRDTTAPAIIELCKFLHSSSIIDGYSTDFTKRDIKSVITIRLNDVKKSDGIENVFKKLQQDMGFEFIKHIVKDEVDIN